MKTKIFALFLGLFFVLSSASAQSVALTGFNGRIDFSSFANSGLNIQGTLKNFTDQTGQYIASQIDTGDIAWDNNGKRYAVVGVISSTATQAVVVLSRIGGGTHLPKGIGLVSRETPNGLTLIPTQNSAGISALLLGRILTNNIKVLGAPYIITGSPRAIPYINSAGRLYSGNNYFILDTATTSGLQTRVRLLINNPNGTAGEGDSYSAISVRNGDGPGSEAIFNIGDQAATMATSGYNSVYQLYRTRGTFEAKTNLLNGDVVGSFAWRGQVNGGSRALGNISLIYTGDGITIRSQIIGNTTTASGIISGFKLDDQSRFWLGNGADDYYFPNSSPSNTVQKRNALYWDGNGSSTTPLFKAGLSYGDGPFSIPAGGEYTITLPFAMSGPIYSVVLTLRDNNNVGTNLTYQIIDQTSTTIKLKFLVANTGVPATGGAYFIYYRVEEF